MRHRRGSPLSSHKAPAATRAAPITSHPSPRVPDRLTIPSAVAHGPKPPTIMRTHAKTDHHHKRLWPANRLRPVVGAVGKSSLGGGGGVVVHALPSQYRCDPLE